LGCGFFEHTIFTLGYTNAPDTEHFGSDFFASLHAAKLTPLNSNVSLIFCFLFLLSIMFFYHMKNIIKTMKSGDKKELGIAFSNSQNQR
jgi:hypothetical protein